MIRRLAIFVALTGCGSPPPFTLKFDLTQSAGNTCTSENSGTIATSCSDVTMSCAATVSIRVLDPNDPTAPYITVCKQLSGKPDLCAIAGVDLPQPAQPIDEQVLEVQMAVYPTIALCKDADGNPLCPSDLQFTAGGFPESSEAECTDTDPCICPPSPAIGGRAYYQPGDSVTVVELGCADPTMLDECTNEEVMVSAAVTDFDTQVSVSQSIANELTVSVGEPTVLGTDYQLISSSAHELTLNGNQPPGWTADVDVTFVDSACLEVLEDGAETTAALTCQCVQSITNPTCPFKTSDLLDLTGVRIAKSTLDAVLSAIGEAQFPNSGLVVGIVLDSNGDPAPGFVVTSSAGAQIEYLSSDRKTIVVGGTSSSGIFVSSSTSLTPPAFKTGTVISTFTTSNGSVTATGYGGLVQSKVTVVVLQLTKPSVGN